jgi:hypothetical protein
MYPSAVAQLARSSSNPDMVTDPLTLDARNITEKMNRVRKFWQQGIKTAATSLVNLPAESSNTTPFNINTTSQAPHNERGPLGSFFIQQPPKDEDNDEV